MVLNREYYERRKIYNSINKENSIGPTPIMHKQFEMDGKFSLDGLESLTKEGWKRLYPLLPEHRTDPKETWVYGDSQAVTIISANYETNHHIVDISLKKYSENNLNAIENIKLVLENKLENKLNEKDESSDLIDKIESN